MAIPEYKILIVGDLGVGKTAIIERFRTGQYRDYYYDPREVRPPPAINVHVRHNFIVNGSPCTVVLCEMRSEFLDEFSEEFSRNDIKADAILMVYNIAVDFEYGSSRYIKLLVRRMKEIYKAKNWTEPVFMLVGNQCDLVGDERKVSTEEGEDFARWFGGIPFKEVSARVNINIDFTFVTLVEAVEEKKRNNQWCSIQ